MKSYKIIIFLFSNILHQLPTKIRIDTILMPCALGKSTYLALGPNKINHRYDSRINNFTSNLQSNNVFHHLSFGHTKINHSNAVKIK